VSTAPIGANDRAAATCNVAVAHIGLLRRMHDGALDAGERARAERFRQHADRARFVTSAALARAAVGLEVGVPPHGVALDRTCPDCGEPHGKPRVVGYDVEISIAHSGDLVAVAWSRAAAVGIDIESRRSRPADHADLASSVCSADEIHAITDWLSFLTCWTRKEAVLKATGDGLRLPMSEVVVSAPHDPPRLLAFPSDPIPACGLATLDVGPDYVGAVAVLTAAPLTISVGDAASMLLDEAGWAPGSGG
jgi:4'-phosphopantetheinyl transferase